MSEIHFVASNPTRPSLTLVHNGDETPSSPRRTKSPQHQRARRDRSAEARHGLIVAGMTTFGRVGFDAATFREISKGAGVTIAAALYHFGTKQRLHDAVVDYVIEQMTRRMERSVHVANNFVVSSSDKYLARQVLKELVTSYINVILSCEESEIWSRFIVRERMFIHSEKFQNYDQHIHGLIGSIIGIIFDIEPLSNEAMIRASAIIAQLSAFGSNQPLLLRRLGRPNLSRHETATVKRILLDHVERIVGSDLTPIFSSTWN